MANTLSGSVDRVNQVLWTKDNPARGQCGVTALVIQDYFGGKILKTGVDNSWHFYNSLDGVSHNLTAEQFESLPEYFNLPASREEAFADTNSEQYTYLSKIFQKRLAEIALISAVANLSSLY